MTDKQEEGPGFIGGLVLIVLLFAAMFGLNVLLGPCPNGEIRVPYGMYCAPGHY